LAIALSGSPRRSDHSNRPLGGRFECQGRPPRQRMKGGRGRKHRRCCRCPSLVLGAFDAFAGPLDLLTRCAGRISPRRVACAPRVRRAIAHGAFQRSEKPRRRRHFPAAAPANHPARGSWERAKGSDGSCATDFTGESSIGSAGLREPGRFQPSTVGPGMPIVSSGHDTCPLAGLRITPRWTSCRMAG